MTAETSGVSINVNGSFMGENEYLHMQSPASNAAPASGGQGPRKWGEQLEEPPNYREKRTWREQLMEYRVVEFGCALFMFAIGQVFAHIEVHQRAIPKIQVRLNSTVSVYSRDSTIDYEKLDQQVTMRALWICCTVFPIAINIIVNYVLPLCKRSRVIRHDTRDFLLSLVLAAGFAQMLTQFIKNTAGRLRPCFYDMCGWQYDAIWDGSTNLCTNAKWESEARKSFPSGHSSYAWATMFLLTLYLLGRSRLNCEDRHETVMRGGRKLLKLLVCFTPSFLAAWVAVTRANDNWHHFSDILTGSLIGIVAAAVAYHYNYGSVFCWESAGIPSQEFHNQRKKRDDDLKDTMDHHQGHQDMARMSRASEYVIGVEGAAR